MSIATRMKRKLFVHLCDIWKSTRTVAAGSPGDETLTLVAINAPCAYGYTKNVDDPTGAGRLKRFNLDTTDMIYLDLNTTIQDNWVTVNRSKNVDRTNAGTFGEVHRVLGAPLKYTRLGNLQIDIQYVECMTMEHVPPTIADYYAL